MGGTFTDLVVVREGGKIQLHKTLTTPADQSEGVLTGLSELASLEGVSLADFLGRTGVIVHGTTTADNTMIEMSGAVTGLLTTEGHRDEIELRRGYKENIWDPALPPPPPICPRRRRIGIPERLDFDGSVYRPLDEDAVRRACRRLRKLGVESVAVCYMFSFLNPAHELRTLEILREELPDVDVSLSHRVYPSAPEFERTSTTVVNAYVGPKIKRYLARLEERLREAGFRGDLRIMQSNGGMMPVEYVLERPVSVLGSGPTGGVMAACLEARGSETPDFIGVDMGGTSYDVCVVRGGTPEVQAGWNWHHRYLVALPMVEVYSVGAGGGSIAEVRGGILAVGPASAGADPGPICYGRGGTRPTVTDANLLLGFLNPRNFCGGRMPLRTEGVEEAVREQIGRPLGLDAIEAAYGIFRLVNANMSNAIRRVSAQRGIDPRGMALVVFGGNGPVHAGKQAEELGIGRILVPRSAPAFSALGLAIADAVVDEVRSYVSPAGRADPDVIERHFRELEDRARSALGGSRKIRFQRMLHVCYPGQTFDMPVPVAGRADRFGRPELERTIERFHVLHEQLHTYASRDEEPIVRAVRLKAVLPTRKPPVPLRPRTRKPPRAALRGKRRVFVDGRFRDVPVYSGPDLLPGQKVEGPAIIEEPFTTVVLYPGHVAELNPRNTYEIRIET